ncbi:MAG: LysR family transcriptional regulator [Acidobacteria bacterium]|nr:LysR family transcriptional regulator [Acidobacteriota bacterium]MCB9398500.1 LysR family transcriptional regulator [Acidobacteriota bacterium]
MNVLEAMRVFVQVAEGSSFSRAAQILGKPKGSISYAIQQLEQEVGTQLLQRSTRRVHLTSDGAIYLERCKRVLEDVEETQGMFLKNHEISGTIRVDMPVGMAKHTVLPALPQFLNSYPGISVELSSTDRLINVIEEGFDFVIRVGALHESGLVCRSLGQLEVVNCASPNYLAQFGTPKTLADLERHQLVGYTPFWGGSAATFEYQKAGLLKSFGMKSVITVNHSESYRMACLLGLGLIQVPEVGVFEDLKQGLLCEVLHEYRPEPMPVNLLYPHRRLGRRGAVFADWLITLLQSRFRAP